MAGPTYQALGKARPSAVGKGRGQKRSSSAKHASQLATGDPTEPAEAIISPSAMRQLLEAYTGLLLSSTGSSPAHEQVCLDLARVLQHALKQDFQSAPAGAHAGPIKHIWERLSASGALTSRVVELVNGLMEESKTFASSLEELDRRVQSMESRVRHAREQPPAAQTSRTKHSAIRGITFASSSDGKGKAKARKAAHSSHAVVRRAASAQETTEAGADKQISISKLRAAADKARVTLEQLDADVRQLSGGQAAPTEQSDAPTFSAKATDEAIPQALHAPDSLLLHVRDMLQTVPYDGAPIGEASLWISASRGSAGGCLEQPAGQDSCMMDPYHELKAMFASLQQGHREQLCAIRTMQQDEEQLRAVLPVGLSALHALLADREHAQQAMAEQATATAELRMLVSQLQSTVQQSARLPGVVTELKSAVSEMQDSAVVLASAVRELGHSISSMQQEHAELKHDVAQIPEMMTQLRDAANNMESEIRAHLHAVELSVMHLGRTADI